MSFINGSPKKCKSCEGVFPLTSFYRKINRFDSCCKACIAQKKASWYKMKRKNNKMQTQNIEVVQLNQPDKKYLSAQIKDLIKGMNFDVDGNNCNFKTSQVNNLSNK